MMRRGFTITATAFGLLVMVAAAVLRWAVAPAVAVLPADTNTTRTYTGTAATLLNPAALTSGGPVISHDVPITVVHHTRVLAASGANALVSDARTVRAGQTTVAAVDYRYAVNRTDLGAGTGYGNVVDQTGLTFNWPIRTGQRDYTGWVPDTQSTTTLRYTGTATHGGVATYVFTANTQPKPITDPQVLKQLPASMPKAALAQLVAGLNLPAAQVAAFRQALPSLPDPVRFAYTYQADATYWVAPQSGIVVDLRDHEVRTVGLSLNGVTVPVTQVMDITFSSPAATLAAAAKDATDNGGAVSFVYDTLPLILLVVGAVIFLVGLGAMLLWRRPPTAHPKPERLTPVG